MEDKLERARFFQETFLLADISVEVVLGMPFLTLRNANIQFPEKEFTWKSYTTAKALPTTKRVKLIDKKEFVKAAPDENSETFLVHVAALEAPLAEMSIHPDREAQIASLLTEKVTIPEEYSDFADVFSEKKVLVLPEQTNLNEHAIKLEGKKQPLYGPIYSLGPVELEILKAYIETHLKTGFIRPFKSPASTPILFNKKPDGSLCLYVDYWGLNNLIIKNRYPLPLIGESLDRLGRAKRFTQLDLTSAYHRMRIKEGDKWKTAFRTWYGHCEYQVMPFGLSNAAASFQGYINKILAKKLNIFVIVYQDHIFIYTEDPGQGYMEAVWWVLDVLQRHRLFANLKKCWFHKDEIYFLGYIVSAQGIRMEDKRIEAVKNWPEPTSVKDIQVFIGFANFYWRFIQGFSRITVPLTSILKTTGSSNDLVLKVFRADSNDIVEDGGGRADETGKNSSKSKKLKNKKSGNLTCTNIKATGEPTFLTPGAREAFNILRQVFTEAPILRHFDPECHIWIETDASGFSIGEIPSQLSFDWVDPDCSILSKFNFGQWHPVAYFSRKMILAKTWYKTHNAELLAIIEAFKTWRHYLEGRKYKVLILNNHNNLRRFMDMKSLSFKQVRWA